MTEVHAKYLISAKAIILAEQQIVLVRNSRNEWDLPGGKLEIGESVEVALRRELLEELDVKLESSELLNAVQHHFYPNILVLVHGCRVSGLASARISAEHSEMGMFDVRNLPTNNMPPGYVPPIQSWIQRESI